MQFPATSGAFVSLAFLKDLVEIGQISSVLCLNICHRGEITWTIRWCLYYFLSCFYPLRHQFEMLVKCPHFVPIFIHFCVDGRLENGKCQVGISEMCVSSDGARET